MTNREQSGDFSMEKNIENGVALETVNEIVIGCRKCPRLVQWREEVARTKVRRFQNDIYWGRPVPGFGDPSAQVVVVGLAPAAHGGNRTGRMFTGDASGDWLVRAMYERGFSNQPSSRDLNDGLQLQNMYMTAAVHCVPPQNRPTPEETRACVPYLFQELHLLHPRVIIVLGHFAFNVVKQYLQYTGVKTRAWRFSHGAHFHNADPSTPDLLCSYHPSRHNTQTGRLDRTMLREVFKQAQTILEGQAHE